MNVLMFSCVLTLCFISCSANQKPNINKEATRTESRQDSLSKIVETPKETDTYSYISVETIGLARQHIFINEEGDYLEIAFNRKTYDFSIENIGERMNRYRILSDNGKAIGLWVEESNNLNEKFEFKFYIDCVNEIPQVFCGREISFVQTNSIK